MMHKRRLSTVLSTTAKQAFFFIDHNSTILIYSKILATRNMSDTRKLLCGRTSVIQPQLRFFMFVGVRVECSAQLTIICYFRSFISS